MQLISLRLMNYCQHRDRFVEFSPKLTGICGANGSGKSNLLAGLRLALTGEDQNVGKMIDNVSQYAGKGERCFVEASFAHHGYTMTVKRHIHPSSQPTLDISQGDVKLETVRGDKRVNARLFEMLETNETTLSDYVLISQGELFSFMAKQAAKRTEAFQRLFRLEQFADAASALHKHAETVRGTLVSQPLDVLRSQIIALEQQSTTARATLATAPLDPELESWRMDAMQRLAAFDNYQMQLRLHQECLAFIARTEAELAKNQAFVAGLMPDHKRWVDYRDSLAARAPQLRQAVAMWNQYQQSTTARAELLKQAAHWTEVHQITTVQEQQLAASPSFDRASAEKSRADMRYELQKRQAMVATFDPSRGTVDCPTCHTPVASLASTLDEARQSLPSLTAGLAQFEAAINQADENARLYAAATQRRLNAGERLAAIQQQLSFHPEMPAAADASAAAAELEQLRKAEETVKAIEAELNGANVRMAAANATLASEYVRRNDFQSTAALVLLPDAAAAVRAELQQRELNASTRARLLTQISFIDNELTAQRANLAQAMTLTSQTATATAWLDRVDAMAVAAHRNNLPQQVIYGRLIELQAATNELLQLFGADFTVKADEDLSFTAEFRDGRNMPAHRLSGGQQTVLAVTFRAAVNLMFAGSVGLLVMDEPTAYLDASYISLFADVIRRLHEWATLRGLQLVMITHERSLIPLFDEVVNL